jgi:Ca2+-binding RTX toxin-like protein
LNDPKPALSLLANAAMPNNILFAEDFSVDPSTPALRIAPGLTWRSPSFAVDSLGYVRLSFRAKLDPSVTISTQPYNKNNLSFVSINPAATWNLDRSNAGPSGGDLIADDYTSLINLTDQWTSQVFYSRAQANAQAMAVSLRATDGPLFIDDIKIENVSRREDVATWADQIWAGRSFSPALNLPPVLKPNHSSEQQKRLARTLGKLQAGSPVRIVLVGDSIVNDLANSAFDVLLERQFPGSSVSVITAVGGGTGMDQWNPRNDAYPFISSTRYNGALNFNDAVIEQRPDLVLLGGISTPGNTAGFSAFQAIIDKLKSASVLSRLGYQPDILLATGAFGNQWQNWYPSSELNASRNDYRGHLLQIANQNNVGFLDLTGIWGDYFIASQNATSSAVIVSPESRNGYWRDTVHANTFGKQILGRALTGFLSQAGPVDLPQPVITLAVAPRLVNEDGDQNLVYTFTRTGAMAGELFVSYTVDGTAKLGADYKGIPPTPPTKIVTFAAGSATATVTVDPIPDAAFEADETVSLKLTAGSGYTIGTTAAVTGTILNRAAPPQLPSITLALSPAAVPEDGTANLTYTFTRTGPTTSPLTVNVTVAGTALAPDPLARLASPPDYTGIVVARPSNTVSFAAGAATAIVVVNPTADTTAESNETVSLTLASGTGYTIGTPSAVTGTILNDDLIGTAANNTLNGSALPEFIDGRQGRDTLTGAGARDVFGFSFGHSTISAPDRITDFRIGVDKIDLFTAAGGALPAPPAMSRAANNTTARTLSDLAAAVFRDANGSLRGNQALGAHRAAVVVATRTPIAGTYLFINDSTAARDNRNDLLINITGVSGGFPKVGSSPVHSFFL